MKRWGSQGEALGDAVDGLLEFGILVEEVLYFLDGVEDGGVVLAAEGAADFGE